MKIKGFAAACALVLAGPAMAGACSTGTTNWGDLSGLGVGGLSNEFSSQGSFNDCYTFSLSAAAFTFGGMKEFDPLFNKLDIDVTSVFLFMGSNLIASDSSPKAFNFGALGAGDYRLQVSGNVTTDPGFVKTKVGYSGALFTVAAPVPEPETYAMLLAGFFGVGVGVLRRKKAAPSA
jgi:PEP-CTERM motif